MSENSEKFISQILKESYPDLDLNPLAPVYDILVRLPASTYIDQILSLVEKTNDNRSLNNFNMPELDYDQLLANWFFSRLPATKTLITVRLYFSERVNIEISNTTEMVINNNVYNPLNTKLYTTLDFKPREDGNAWYIDVSSVSSLQGAIEVGVNQNVTITVPSNKYIGAEVITVNSIGNDPETNTQAYSRLQEELGIKNLVNNRSISNVLSEKYSSFVTGSFVAGYSEMEQIRDVVSVEIPRKKVRLFFTNKINIFIPSNTYFYIDGTTSYYTNKEIMSVESTSGLWQEDALGNFYIDVSVESDTNNSLGFPDDYVAKCSYLEQEYSMFKGGQFKYVINNSSKIKIGGKTDIFLRTVTETTTLTVNMPGNTDGFISIPSNLSPVLKVNSVYSMDGNNPQPIDIYQIVPLNATERFSSREQLELYVDVEKSAGLTIYVDLIHSPYINVLQNDLNDTSKKVLGEDILVRYMNPIFLDIYGVALGDSYEKDTILESITQYVNSIPIGNNNYLSLVEMLAYVQNTTSLSNLFLDTLYIRAEHHLPDGSIVELENLEIIEPLTNTELGVSPRNSCFIINSIDIIFR